VPSAVSLTFRYGPGEYVRAVNAYQRTQLRPVADSVFSAAFLAGGACAISLGGAQYFWLGILFLGFGLAIPLLVGFFLLLPRVMFANNPKFRFEYCLTFSEEGIHFRTTAIDSRLDWSLYKGATEVRAFYLLHYGRRDCTVVPKRAFKNAADMQVFDALLVARLPKVERRA
jgi:YcxB-like protein